MPVCVHVVDHPEGPILVDTGLTELHPAVADMDPRSTSPSPAPRRGWPPSSPPRRAGAAARPCRRLARAAGRRQPTRFRLLADAYGLSGAERGTLVDLGIRRARWAELALQAAASTWAGAGRGCGSRAWAS